MVYVHMYYSRVLMETQSKPVHSETNAKNGSGEIIRKESPSISSLLMELVLRMVATGATLAAAIVMGRNKQTKIIALHPLPDTPPILISVPAKYHYSSAFVFFVVANAVACGYTVLSIIITMFKLNNSRWSTLSTFLLSITDLVMLALVSSGASAAAAVGYIGWKGNSHIHWAKICNVFDRLCHHVAGALIASFLAVPLFMILTVISSYTLYKRTRLPS